MFEAVRARVQVLIKSYQLQNDRSNSFQICGRASELGCCLRALTSRVAKRERPKEGSAPLLGPVSATTSPAGPQVRTVEGNATRMCEDREESSAGRKREWRQIEKAW